MSEIVYCVFNENVELLHQGTKASRKQRNYNRLFYFRNLRCQAKLLQKILKN